MDITQAVSKAEVVALARELIVIISGPEEGTDQIADFLFEYLSRGEATGEKQHVEEDRHWNL